MVEFLEDAKASDCIFKKGKRYASIDNSKARELKDKILVRQPNSPRKRNWWASFPKSCEGEVFKTLDNEEMTYSERIEENRLLQL